MKLPPSRSVTTATTEVTATTDQKNPLATRTLTTIPRPVHDSIVQCVFSDSHAPADVVGSDFGDLWVPRRRALVHRHGGRRQDLPALRKRRRKNWTRCPRLPGADVLL